MTTKLRVFYATCKCQANNTYEWVLLIANALEQSIGIFYGRNNEFGQIVRLHECLVERGRLLGQYERLVEASCRCIEMSEIRACPSSVHTLTAEYHPSASRRPCVETVHILTVYFFYTAHLASLGIKNGKVGFFVPYREVAIVELYKHHISAIGRHTRQTDRMLRGTRLIHTFRFAKSPYLGIEADTPKVVAQTVERSVLGIGIATAEVQSLAVGSPSGECLHSVVAAKLGRGDYNVVGNVIDTKIGCKVAHLNRFLSA